MILSTHGIVGSQIGQFPQVSDADAQLFVNRVYTAGGVLSTTELSAVNQLVIDLKGYSIWTKMKAIYPMVGASAAACSQNLKSSSFTGTFTSGWTFASTGATPNGTSAFFNTNINLLNDLSQNDTHCSVYLRTDVQGVRAAVGAGVGNGNAILMYPYLAGGAYINLFSDGGNNLITSASNSLRFRILNRISSSQVNYFTNTSKSTLNLTSTTGTNKNIYISAHNSGTNPSTPTAYDNRENCFASFGQGLSDTEASNFYTAVQAFQTTLSRQV